MYMFHRVVSYSYSPAEELLSMENYDRRKLRIYCHDIVPRYVADSNFDMTRIRA